ncbi:MAG: 30S ribosomal protein S4 [Candidatus Nanoarchaeia archaeon]
MGDIKLKQKQYSKPRRLFNSERIKSENDIIKRYGLKNKREVWKAKSDISKIRRKAKDLISASEQEQKAFFDKLNKTGFKVEGIADVLALTEEDLLRRRLQTFIYEKGMANSPRQARQLIVHKNVLVNDSVVDLENKIKIREPKKKELIEKEDKKTREQAKEKQEEKAASGGEENKEEQDKITEQAGEEKQEEQAEKNKQEGEANGKG